MISSYCLPLFGERLTASLNRWTASSVLPSLEQKEADFEGQLALVRADFADFEQSADDFEVGKGVLLEALQKQPPIPPQNWGAAQRLDFVQIV